MVGHIYKDFKAETGLLLCFAMLAGFVVLLSVQGGSEEELREMLAIVAWGLFMVNFFIPLLSMFATYEADEKEKWTDYAMVLPGGVRGYVKSKYMFIGVLIVISAAFTHVYACIFDGACNKSFLTQFDYLITMVAAGAGMIICAFYFPFVFRFGSQKGNGLVGAIILLLLLGSYCYMMFGDLSIFSKEDLEGVLWRWFQHHYETVVLAVLLLFFMGILAMAVSYQLSLRIFQKGVAERE